MNATQSQVAGETGHGSTSTVVTIGGHIVRTDPPATDSTTGASDVVDGIILEPTPQPRQVFPRCAHACLRNPDGVPIRRCTILWIVCVLVVCSVLLPVFIGGRARAKKRPE